MDAVLDEIANSLLNQRLPDVWRKLAPDTCMQLAAWLNHLQVNRCDCYTYVDSDDILNIFPLIAFCSMQRFKNIFREWKQCVDEVTYFYLSCHFLAFLCIWILMERTLVKLWNNNILHRKTCALNWTLVSHRHKTMEYFMFFFLQFSTYLHPLVNRCAPPATRSTVQILVGFRRTDGHVVVWLACTKKLFGSQNSGTNIC